MSLKIKTFGKLTEIIGAEDVPSDTHDTDSLKAALILRFPALAEMTFMIAVDKKIVQGNTTLHSDAEIALLPPFSGG